MVESVSIADWTRFDAEHPAPTFFARPAWALALQESYPGCAATPLRVRLGDGRYLLVPLIQENGGPLRWRSFCGFPLGAYTCFIHEDGTLASTAQATEAVEQLARYCDVLRIFPWPLAPRPAIKIGVARAHETAVIDLSHGIEVALAGVTGISRRMAGQAARRGVSCAPSTDPDAVDRYFGLLAEAAKRWGLPRTHLSKQLLESVVRLGGRDAEVWFAQHDGEIIAGGVVLFGARELFFWTAAMRHEHGRLRPSNALNIALLHAAAERNVTWYNLGSSEGLPGVARFKRDLGAHDVSYTETEITTLRYSLYSQLRRAVTPRHSA
ncbi:MAG: GNAT family N-acetyltransferase [Vulcanimicrobiaceae bacterium]